MLAEGVSPLTALLSCVVFSAVCCQATSEPDGLISAGSDENRMGGLKSMLKDAISPAFGAAIIIIITVVMSGSAYLCFLKYVCAGCCKPMQVAPAVDAEPDKAEEQV